MGWFFKFMLVIVCSYFFNLGLMLMDYGATFKDVGYCQSLIFERIEPRVVYHSGLLLVTCSFLILTLLCAHYLLIEKCRQEIPEKKQ
jgi:hypothetical protein